MFQKLYKLNINCLFVANDSNLHLVHLMRKSVHFFDVFSNFLKFNSKSRLNQSM